MYEFTTMLAGGRDQREMGATVLEAIQKAAKEGWEPISFTPIGFKLFTGAPENMEADPILNYRLAATAQQIVFRRPVQNS